MAAPNLQSWKANAQKVEKPLRHVIRRDRGWKSGLVIRPSARSDHCALAALTFILRQ